MVFVGDKRKVDIAQIVEDGTPTCPSAHQVAPIFLQLLHIAFGVWVLVLPYDDGTLILPQIERHPAIWGQRKEIVLNSDVEVRVKLGGYDYLGHLLIVNS